jgi:hypothetical protein
MAMRTKYECMGCVDCLMLVANGDVPDERPSLSAEMVAHMGADDVRHLCVGDSEKDDEFSWSACECCGSTLGGSRHHFVVLEQA